MTARSLMSLKSGEPSDEFLWVSRISPWSYDFSSGVSWFPSFKVFLIVVYTGSGVARTTADSFFAAYKRYWISNFCCWRSLSMRSCSFLLGKARVRTKPRIAPTIKTTIGIGSSISLTNETPIVQNFESRMMKLIAVALRLNGKRRSS